MKKYVMILVLVLCIAGICGLNVISDYAWTRGETKGFPLGIGFWHIEKLKDGKWQKVPFLTEGRVSYLIAYQIAPGDCQEHEICWDYEIGRLSSGKYRIVVPIYKSTWREVDDYLYARFIIR